jgi:hypothetical protein
MNRQDRESKKSISPEPEPGMGVKYSFLLRVRIRPGKRFERVAGCLQPTKGQ